MHCTSVLCVDVWGLADVCLWYTRGTCTCISWYLYVVCVHVYVWCMCAYMCLVCVCDSVGSGQGTEAGFFLAGSAFLERAMAL